MPPGFTWNSGVVWNAPGAVWAGGTPQPQPTLPQTPQGVRRHSKPMNDYYLNRINMGRKVFACLDDEAHEPLWKNVPPLRLTAAVAEARVLMAGLEKLAQEQGQATTGSAADKRREEKELEDAAHELGRLVVRCCRSEGDETGAATFDLSLTGWRKMRDEVLLQTARSLETKAAACAATAKGAEYGITALKVAALKKEADDYEKFIVAPDAAISGRAATTRQLRPAFIAFEDQLEEIDDLVLPLRATAAGALFVSKYDQARSINDRGHGPGEDEPEPPAPPPPPVAPV